MLVATLRANSPKSIAKNSTKLTVAMCPAFSAASTSGVMADMRGAPLRALPWVVPEAIAVSILFLGRSTSVAAVCLALAQRHRCHSG